jgi:hypothetical protein
VLIYVYRCISLKRREPPTREILPTQSYDSENDNWKTITDSGKRVKSIGWLMPPETFWDAFEESSLEISARTAI